VSRGRPLSGALRAVIAAELSSHAAAAERAIAAALGARSFDRPLVRMLGGLARERGNPRELRLLACVLLELQVRLAAPDDGDELARVLGEPCVLGELQRKVARFEALHASIRGWKTPARVLRALIRRIDSETTVMLARWFFTPAEVVSEIVRRVRVSTGISGAHELARGFIGAEIAETMRRLPAYERQIIRRLADGGRVLWVGDRTPCASNALVEYPEGTVALVVKPPGSDLEIEIKRAGLRGPRPLDVRLHDADGKLVPRHHHLWGGAMGDYLTWETRGAAAIARLYRAVHHEEPPVSRVVTRTMILTVPVRGGEETVIDYFTGIGSELPRVNAQLAPRRLFDQLRDDPVGLFLLTTTPHQSLVIGTSSFRLDRLHATLQEDGPEAGPLLEEILEPYAPVRGDSVSAAFAANRAAADAAHLDAVLTLAKLWGTLVAAGANSEGESFVARNVGLRKVWRGGAWRVAVISMDHDAVDGFTKTELSAEWLLSGTLRDRAHLVGGRQKHRTFPGSLGMLDAIYRIEPALAAARRTRFIDAAVEAFRTTRRAMRDEPRVRAMFRPKYVERMLLWEACARELIDGKTPSAWQRAVRARLRGHSAAVAEEFIHAGMEYRDVLADLAPFYCA